MSDYVWAIYGTKVHLYVNPYGQYWRAACSGGGNPSNPVPATPAETEKYPRCKNCLSTMVYYSYRKAHNEQ